jgi:hypothetical protein
MSLFEEASLVITPNGFKAGKLYAVKGTDLNVVRATSATRVNANGLIETVASNVPRIDYTGGGCPSILVEPQRTNLVLNSATVTTQTINVTAVSHTISFYGSGTITLSGTHTATVVGLGTARKTYTFTPTAGNLVLTVSGTCTNGQLEAGSYATSYIPTTSASVTRNADVISKTGISSLIGQTEGTIFVDIYNQLLDSTLLCINKNNANGIFIDISKTGTIIGRYYANSILTFTSATTYTTFNQRIKVALKYGSFGIKLFVNGVLKGTNSTSIAFTSSLSEIFLNDGVVVNFNEKIINNNVQVYKNALTDTECINLTTI